jgi:hypothetical protein
MRQCLVFAIGAIGAVTLACGANNTEPDTSACGITALAGAPASSCGGTSSAGGASNFGGAAIAGGASNLGGASSTGAALPGAAPSAAGGAAPAMGASTVPGAGGIGFPATGSGGVSSAGGAIGTGAPVTGNSGGSVGAGGAGPTTTSVPFSSISTLLAASCGGTSCHTTRQKPALANNPNLRMALLDTVVSECGGAHLVVPGNPEGSAIIQLVNRRCTKSGRAFYMPRNCTTNPCLPAAQLQTLTSWIQAGAPAQ